GNVGRRDVLVPRLGHLQARGQIRPQLEAVHMSARVAFGHFLVHDAAPGGHPLHVPRPEAAAVAERVPMFDVPRQNVRDRLDPAIRSRRAREPPRAGIPAAAAGLSSSSSPATNFRLFDPYRTVGFGSGGFSSSRPHYNNGPMPVRLESQDAIAFVIIDNPPVNALSAGIPEGLAASIAT